MQIEDTKLPGVWSFQLERYPDFRGSYQTLFTDNMFYDLTGEHIEEGNLVDNFAGTFRGYHYSPHSWKIYLCLEGTLHYYLVGWDKDYYDYGEWTEITLLPYQGFIKHPRYATGMWSITDSKLMVVQSQVYNPSNPDQETITIKQVQSKLDYLGREPIFYPDIPMVVSKRDRVGKYDLSRI